MNGIFYIGATGLNAQQKAVDIVANNVTNLNTAAYKRASVSFSELLAPVDPTSERPHRNAAEASAAGVLINPTLHNFAPAELHPTTNELDLAVRGEGFIPLAKTGDEAILWRGGTLHVNADGYLAAPNGLPLEAMISVPHDATSLTISANGQVLAHLPNQREPAELGQIDLVTLTDTRRLESLGNGVYGIDESTASLAHNAPGEDGAGSLAQGFSEASNVQLSDELVNLMIYQRAYASNARLVQVGDELMAIANGLKRG